MEMKPRLSVELTEEQAEGLRTYIPMNLKSVVIRALIDLLLDALKRGSPTAIVASILTKDRQALREIL